MTPVTPEVKTPVTQECVTVVIVAERDLETRRFLLLIEQLAEVKGSKKAAARHIRVDPSYVVKLVSEPERKVGLEVLKRAEERLGLDSAFFHDASLGDAPSFQGHQAATRIERDVPESFRIWREQLGPKDLPADVEARMLETGFRYAPEDAARWTIIYHEVVAELRGRRVASSVRASEEETARAKEEAEKAGLMKPQRSKK